MNNFDINFLRAAEKITQLSCEKTDEYCLSEVVGRIAAVILLTPAAAIDFTSHLVLTLGTFAYSCGASIYHKKADFQMPWHHLQRVRQSISPLLFSSFCGLFHPQMGIAVAEMNEKDPILEILCPNARIEVERGSSPITSLGLIEEAIQKDKEESSPNFTEEHTEILGTIRSYERSLEALQFQEWIYRITNITHCYVSFLSNRVDEFEMHDIFKGLIKRLIVLVYPFVATLDLIITAVAQSILVTMGIFRLITGQGPSYFEMTINPLVHIAILIQTIIKTVGQALGMAVWVLSPEWGMKVAIYPIGYFYKLEMAILMMFIKSKINNAKDKERFVLPIGYIDGKCDFYDVPFENMHMTYLIVEKDDEKFNLSWVEGSKAKVKKGMDGDATKNLINEMFDSRFPFMNIEKMLSYPVTSSKPEFPKPDEVKSLSQNSSRSFEIAGNLFNTFEALDGTKSSIRSKAVRKALMKKYEPIQRGVFPGYDWANDKDQNDIWNTLQNYKDCEL